MTIRGIVFDIGGVLEITPRTGWQAGWELQLNLQPGELNERLMPVWRGGSSGELSEEEVNRGIAEILSLDDAQLEAFLGDLWGEYLGTINLELARYFAGLRPRYKTAILSNSFAGARRREQAAYGFGDTCDFIVYSHEEGIKKPDYRIYKLTCERLGLPPNQVIFLDDVEEAIMAAREVGIHGIQFKNNTQAIADIETLLALAD